MTDSEKIALILCLDENKANLYEEECKLAVKSWRSLNHQLKDIDIYVYINKSANIKQETLDFLKSFNNVFFKYYNFFMEQACLNTLYCQYLFEKDYSEKYDYSIYTDTDLYIQKPIPSYLFYRNKNVFLTYDLSKNLDQLNDGNLSSPILYRYLNNTSLNIKTFNTLFVVNVLKNKLFAELKKLLTSLQHKSYFQQYILFDNDSYYFEESIYDFAYQQHIINNNNSIILNEQTFINNQNLGIDNSKTYLFYHQHLKNQNEQ